VRTLAKLPESREDLPTSRKWADMWENISFAVLGGLVVGLFALVYGLPRRTGKDGGWAKRSLSPTFARVYGLMSVAVLAIVAVKLTTDAAILTGLFTLFGTIAGYLAGSRVESITKGNKETEGDLSASDVSLELN